MYLADPLLALVCSFLTVPEAARVLTEVFRRPKLVVPWTDLDPSRQQPERLLKLALLSHLRSLEVYVNENVQAVASVLSLATNLSRFTASVAYSALKSGDRLFPGTYPSVQSLTLYFSEMSSLTPQFLRQTLDSFPRLRTIKLGHAMSKEHLQVLVECCPGLTNLSLGFSSLMQPEDLLVLQGLQGLESCDFRCSRLGMMRCLQDFSECLHSVGLEFYSSRKPGPSDKFRLPPGVREFRCWSKTASAVSLERCRLVELDAHPQILLSAFRQWPHSVAQLTSLDTTLTDDLAKVLPELKALTCLSLIIEDRDPQPLDKECPSVRSLTLLNLKYGDMAWLRTFPNLESLELDSCVECLGLDPDISRFEAFDVLPKLQRLVDEPEHDAPVVTVGRGKQGELVKCWGDQRISR